MKDLIKNVKKVPGPKLTCKKVPGPKLKNSRNYTYSTCCDYSTKLLPRSNGTNVEVRNNIENIEDL